MKVRSVVLSPLSSVVCLLGLFLFLSATDAQNALPDFQGLEEIPDMRLQETIKHYYRSEYANDWAATYKFRSEAFRNLVPFTHYKKGMDHGMNDWKLLRLDIVKSTLLNTGEMKVMILFYENFGMKAAKEYFGGRVFGGVNKRQESTTWRPSKSGWIAVEVGDRGHLPLNRQLIR